MADVREREIRNSVSWCMGKELALMRMKRSCFQLPARLHSWRSCSHLFVQHSMVPVTAGDAVRLEM